MLFFSITLIVFPDISSQRDLEMMYRLTGRMTSEEPGAVLELESVSVDTLEAKGIESGKSLLMYAAEAGEKEWFTHLVNVIKSEVWTYVGVIVYNLNAMCSLVRHDFLMKKVFHITDKHHVPDS